MANHHYKPEKRPGLSDVVERGWQGVANADCVTVLNQLFIPKDEN
jgi:hypothetical protein